MPEPIKLNQANLAHLASAVQVPTYDRKTVAQSIVHIGVGGFFRAHQAVYLDDLLHQPGHAEWGYCGVGLLKHDEHMRNALLPQDCLYTVVERSASGDQARVVGSVLNFLHALDNPQAVIEKMASPECRIVSLTITESGYYINEGSGEFNDTHPDIVHDLQHPHEPRCSFGYLVEALDLRRRRGLAPFTVMSCDNVQHNGDVARKMIMAFVERRDPDLHQWIAEHCTFPNSMVDRIVPATTDEHRAVVRDKFGIEDAWPAGTEPFRQWVIEDNFPNGRPAWEQVGALMTADVSPYEMMKMRLLNGSHQAMCYIGILLGLDFAHECMQHPQIRRLVRTMMDEEVTPLLTAPQGIDLTDYKNTLIERFSNPTIKDQLPRIATEGSARMPKFILPSIVEQLQHGGSIKLLAFTVAAWFRFLTGSDEQGREVSVIDPMKDVLMERARRGGRSPSALLELGELFGETLTKSPVFVEQVSSALNSFYDKGAPATLTDYVGS